MQEKRMAGVASLVSRIFHPGFQTVAPASFTFVLFPDLSNAPGGDG